MADNTDVSAAVDTAQEAGAKSLSILSPKIHLAESYRNADLVEACIAGRGSTGSAKLPVLEGLRLHPKEARALFYFHLSKPSLGRGVGTAGRVPQPPHPARPGRLRWPKNGAFRFQALRVVNRPYYGLRIRSGSLAMLAAIRRASSLVSRFAAVRLPGSSSK